MTHSRRTGPRRGWIPAILATGVLVVGATIAAAVGDDSVTPITQSTAAPVSSSAPASSIVRASQPGVRLGEADGLVPDRTTVFDIDLPAVANLDPALLAALQRAAKEARNDRVELVVNSGWRSPRYQEELLRGAVSRYGSEEEAARWVGTPKTSAHVSGDAVDIGPARAVAWLAKRGARYGLCAIYRNEPWHFELVSDAADSGCPPMYADPTQDPRIQQ